MAKVVFFSIPAHGHTNPTLPVVQELVKHGEDVIYYSSPEFRDRVLATGAQYRGYHIKQDQQFIQQTGKDLALLYYFMVKSTEDVLRALVNDVRQMHPDYIIHDAICPWGRYMATILNIPAVSSISTFAMNPQVADLKKTMTFFRHSTLRSVSYILAARKIQQELKKQYSVQPRGLVETMMNEENLNIVYTSSLLQPNADSFDTKKYKFVGPSISDRSNDPDKTGYAKLEHPLIYVSMGTIWKDSINLDNLIDALVDFNGTIVVSGSAPTKKYERSEQVIMMDHINQLEILKNCDIFITHGGMNSVNEALFWGVPMCLHPFQVEQEIVVDRIVELHCGVKIDRFTQENIRFAVQKVLNDSNFRKNCSIISQSFKQSGGYRKATEYILAYACPAHKTPHLTV